MDPETRTLLQVTVEQAAIADEVFAVSDGRRRRESASTSSRPTPTTSGSWTFRSMT